MAHVQKARDMLAGFPVGAKGLAQLGTPTENGSVGRTPRRVGCLLGKEEGAAHD